LDQIGIGPTNSLFYGRPSTSGSRQAESAEGGTSKTQTSANRGAREMVEVRCTGILQLSCGPQESASLRSFRLQVIRRWMRALRRRSQKSRLTWPRLVALAQHWLPNLASFIPIPICASTPGIRGKNRMQQSCTCGSGAARLAAIPVVKSPDRTLPVTVVVISSSEKGNRSWKAWT